jgi:hypothetical protein
MGRHGAWPCLLLLRRAATTRRVARPEDRLGRMSHVLGLSLAVTHILHQPESTSRVLFKPDVPADLRPPRADAFPHVVPPSGGVLLRSLGRALREFSARPKSDERLKALYIRRPIREKGGTTYLSIESGPPQIRYCTPRAIPA